MDSAQIQERSAATEIRRLEARLDSGTPVERIDTLNELASLLSRSDATLALTHATRALDLTRAHGYQRGLAVSLQVLAQINWKLGAHDASIRQAGEAIEEFEALGDVAAMGRSHMVIGCVRINQSRLADATESILTGRRLCGEGGDLQGEAIALDTLGVICSEQQQFEQGHKYRLESAQILEQIGDQYRLAVLYVNMGNFHRRKEELEQALGYYRTAISILEEKEPAGYPIAAAHHNLGDVSLAKGEPEEALAAFQRGLEIRTAAGDERGMLFSCTAIGELLLDQGSLGSAEEFLTTALEKAIQLDLPRMEQMASLRLSRVAEARSEFERALRLQKRASEIQAQIFDEEQTRAIAEMQAKYEADRKEQEAEMHQLKYVRLKEEVARREQAEHALIQAQKLESLGLMAGGIAHDFNNILHCVLGYTSLAARNLNEDHPASRHLELAQKSAQNAAGLAHQMLAYAGCRHYELKPCDVNVVVESSRELIHGAAGGQLTLRFNLAPQLPTVRAEASQVHQIVANLVINAAEANASTIEIATELREIRESDHEYWTFTGEVRQPGPYVVLTVKDDGHGMEEDVLNRIFDPFYSTKQTGKGLGLAAVLGILRGHGGGISVRSEIGGGSVFESVFPTAPIETPASVLSSIGSEPDAGTSRSKRTILVIDDEQPVRELLATILGAEGYSVVTAVDGESGILAFEKRLHEIEGVILDMTMPGLDALTVWKELHELDPNVRIILTSGYDRSAALVKFGEDVAFLEKPYSPSDLISILDRTLDSPA